jgi:two-component system, sensor histidine kinase PdtaS
MSDDANIAGNRLLGGIITGMPITADLSRSDLLLVRPMNPEQVVVVAQAQPHSISPLHSEDLTDRIFTGNDAPVILDAWRRCRHMRVHVELPGKAQVVQDVRPIQDKTGQVIGLLSIETSLIQLERHRQRRAAFRQAIEWLKAMCARGELGETARLSPFFESDGIVLIDGQRRITYVSGIATSLYRRLGYQEDLRGRRLSYLQSCDDEMAAIAIENRRPAERESATAGHIYIRKVLPVWPPPTLRGRMEGWHYGRGGRGEVDGVLIMVHDATEERRKRQELEVKTTMIQEVHHRVKNNLQTIAAVLRMQARRAEDGSTQQALKEAINRILSVAVIHEFLSLDESQTINVRDVCQRIVAQTRQVLVPGQLIEFSVEGPAIYLPSQQATACALVMNELIQNALEHGFGDKKRGTVTITLADNGDTVQVDIWDDGDPLPDDFSLDVPTSLGLQIVRTLVQGDLRGQVKLENGAGGVIAKVSFPKTVVPGTSATVGRPS